MIEKIIKNEEIVDSYKDKLELCRKEWTEKEPISFNEIFTRYIALICLKNDMVHDYEALKLALKIKKLDLKYGEDFKQFKTVKEKEERAEMATATAKLDLIETEKIIKDLEALISAYSRLMESYYEYNKSDN